jgi:hypothetical protein
MVKMETTEPSVELKLKKGGSVKKANGGMMGAMPPAPMGAMPARGGSPSSATPMAPSLAARRRAMRKMGAGPSAPVGLAASRMMKEGGKSDKAQDKAMIQKAFKQHDMQEHKGGKGTKLALKKGGMSTGGVTKGNGGGYKAGGAMKKMATGGVVKGQGGYAMGGMIPSESMSGTPATTMMDTARYDNAPAMTGGVRDGNAGGYKRGGATKKHFATGGSVNSTGSAVAMPQGRKPASPPVKTNQVSGTYKKGGKVAPGNKQLQAVNKMENATAMRQAKMDSNLKYGPANTLKMQKGGSPDDRYVVKDPKAVSDKASRELEEALNPLSMVEELYNKARGAFGAKGSVNDKERDAAGSVTKTKESVTVSPGKKRGGSVC